MHIYKCNLKSRDNEFAREKGGMYGRAWRNEREEKILQIYYNLK